MSTTMTYDEIYRIHQLNPQLIIPAVARKIGRPAAMILSQMLYWLSKSKHNIDGKVWIYNTAKQWQLQLCCYSLPTIKRAISSLEFMGIIISMKKNAKRWNHTKWYATNDDALHNFFSSICKEELQNIKLPKLKGTSPRKATSKTNSNPISTPSQEGQDPLKNVPIKKKQRDQSRIVSALSSLKQTKTLPDSNFHSPHLEQALPTTSKDEKNLIITDEEKEKISKKMVAVWNEEFQYAVNPIKAFSNKQTYDKLFNLFTNTFNRDIESWRSYCLKVNSSKFLMGEQATQTKFKASFPWLITTQTAEKILSGGYGIGDRMLDKNSLIANVQKLRDKILADAHKRISNYFRSKTPQNTETRFRLYLLNEEYKKDGDQYNLFAPFNGSPNIPGYNIVHNTQYSGFYHCLYDSYLAYIYSGKSSLEIRNQLSTILDQMCTGYEGIKLFSKLRELERIVETLCIKQFGDATDT